MALMVQGSATPKGGSGQPDRDLHNARALGNALLVCMTLPWGLCCLFYIGMALASVMQKKGHLDAAPSATTLRPKWPQAVSLSKPQDSVGTCVNPFVCALELSFACLWACFCWTRGGGFPNPLWLSRC